MATRNIPMDEAGPQASDVMLRAPRTVAPETTVAEARETFENPRVRLLLVARGDTYLGVVTRDSLPADADPDGDARRGRPPADAARVAPADPVARAVELLDADGDRPAAGGRRRRRDRRARVLQPQARPLLRRRLTRAGFESPR